MRTSSASQRITGELQAFSVLCVNFVLYTVLLWSLGHSGYIATPINDTSNISSSVVCRYAQCLPISRVENKIAESGWDGSVLTCEEMPDELDPQRSRRLLDVVPARTSGGYGDVPSSLETEVPRATGSGCETCAPMFGQCAANGEVVSCCSEGLQCIKKNGFFGTTVA